MLECPNTVPFNSTFYICDPQRASGKVCDYAGRYEYVVDALLDSLGIVASGTNFRDEMDLTGYFCQSQRSPKRRECANPQRETDDSLAGT